MLVWWAYVESAGEGVDHLVCSSVAVDEDVFTVFCCEGCALLQEFLRHGRCCAGWVGD